MTEYKDNLEPKELMEDNKHASDMETTDQQCGLGRFRPARLQMCARIGAFIGIYGISGLLTSTLGVYINSQVSMLEKQFGFSSSESGVIMSCNDIGYLCCVIFAGYIAKKIHIPRGLGFSTMLFGVCGILCALPYFIQDRAMFITENSRVGAMAGNNRSREFGDKLPICVNETFFSGEASCNFKSNSVEESQNIERLNIKRIAFSLIAFGMLLQGVGKSCRIPFVTLYIDDTVHKSKTGFYMGILTSTGIFGPALAYLLGGLFSKIYVTLESVDITPLDPRWIGAWWLGFVVFGGLSIIASVPIMCFPRTLKSKCRIKEQELKAKEEHTMQSASKTFIHELKEFGLSVARVIRNPTFNLLTMSTCFNLLGVAGVQSFMPKYLAAQYSVPLWHANIIMSLSSITAVALGSFFGGVMTRRLKMTPITTFKLLIIFYAVNIVCNASGFFLGCDQPLLVGDQFHSTVNIVHSSTGQTCAQGCNCNKEIYFPICGDDGRSYFSPCYAGCTANDVKEFWNCTCIPNGHAVAGLCKQDCTTQLYAYAVVTFIGKLFAAFKIIPIYIGMIRCVDDRDRAESLAFSGFMTSIIGWMPGPILFGFMIDGTCLLWKHTCGERQSCQLYDIVYFRNSIHGYATVTTICALLTIVPLYVYFRAKRQTQWRKVSVPNNLNGASFKNGRIYQPLEKTIILEKK